MSLTIVEQPTPLSLDRFDFVSHDLEDYCKYFKALPKQYEEKKLKALQEQYNNCYILNYSGKNTWNVLSKILPEDYELLKISSQYECPFTEFTHTSLWPAFILTENPIDYIRMVDCTEQYPKLPWYADMACDASWNYDKEVFKPSAYLSKISRSFIGPGFTQTFYPNDGNSDYALIAMDLSNGDTLVFVVLEWYNK